MTKVEKPATVEQLKQWVGALRSGNYRQCRGALNRGNKFCCLGVANDIFNLKVNRGNGRLCKTDDQYVPTNYIFLPVNIQNDLISMNDNREIKFTFKTIADYIEKSIIPTYKEKS